MATTKKQPADDPSSAPESGTVRDETTGNQTARPNDRPGPAKPASEQKDDPSVAGEER